jgi:membrane fusion protein (multidrug efflux system)
VRIDFTDLKDEDANHLLRPGLSVEPTVRVKQ